MKIIVDIDDVLADTVAALVREWGPAEDPTSESLQDFFPGVDYQLALQDPAFNLSIPPVEGSVEGVMRLVKVGHTILYLSARIPGLTDATLEWLNTWQFPGAQLHCVGREAKQAMLRTQPYDLLIDDQLRYLEIAEQRGIRVLAYAYPWNASWGGPRLTSWDALIAAI
jgi:hypothetical protein